MRILVHVTACDGTLGIGSALLLDALAQFAHHAARLCGAHVDGPVLLRATRSTWQGRRRRAACRCDRGSTASRRRSCRGLPSEALACPDRFEVPSCRPPARLALPQPTRHARYRHCQVASIRRERKPNELGSNVLRGRRFDVRVLEDLSELLVPRTLSQALIRELQCGGEPGNALLRGAS